MPQTIFDKIISREIQARIVYEDDHVLAFHDVAPEAPVHILVIPKKPIENLLATTDHDTQLLGQLLAASVHIARAEGLADDGFRVVINTSKNGGQSVDHMHLHILGGRHMAWPPG
jgi:histidine triad (HIT) family protein